MISIPRPLNGFWLILILALAVGAQQPLVVTPAPGMDAHARQVISEARKAIGSSGSTAGLHSLEVNMSVRRLMGPAMRRPGPAGEQFSNVQLQFAFPNAFRRVIEVQPFAGYAPALTLTQVQNGDQAWLQAKGRHPFPFRRRGRMIIKSNMAPPTPGAAGSAAQGQTAAPGGAQKIVRNRFWEPPPGMMARRLQQQADHDLLAMMLWTPRDSDLQWHYFGTAKLKDGVADVVDIAGPNHFAARLFLDQATHRLVMMSYIQMAPPPMFGPMFGQRFRTMRFRRGFERGPMGPHPLVGRGFMPGAGPHPMPMAPQAARPGAPAGPVNRFQAGPGPRPWGQFRGPRRFIARPGARPFFFRPRPQPVVLHFSNFSREHGVLMPHTIVATRFGRPVEEMTIKSVEWNPAIPASAFQKGGQQ